MEVKPPASESTAPATPPVDLAALRVRMDSVNERMLALFEERMALSDEIAALKRVSGQRPYDPAREREIIARVRSEAPEGLGSAATVLFSLLMEMSRGRQDRLLRPSSPLGERVAAAVAESPSHLTAGASVAVLGIEGSYSQLACEKMFKRPSVSFFRDARGVVRAVAEGLCDYGVLPFEFTGEAGEGVVDLLCETDCHIVRMCEVRVARDLLALPGATLEGLREVVSDPRAAARCCAGTLARDGVRFTTVGDAAEAARAVASSGRLDLAALCGRACADVYGLVPLERQVDLGPFGPMRFACVGPGLRILPGADRTAIRMTLPNEPGSLYRVLARVYALDVNVASIASLPSRGCDEEARFLCELEASVYTPEFASLVCELDDICAGFSYLGSYCEVR